MLSKHVNSNIQGFTLIESLVTVAIVGVIAAITAPSFFGALTNKRVDDVLAKVEGALKEAQSTAVKKSRSCTLMLTAQRVSAVRIDAVTGTTSADLACLPTGERDFSASGNIALLGTAGSTGTPITFSLKGSTPVTQTTETILVRRTDTTSNQRIKCLVISSGVGLIRTGNYADLTVPDIADLPLRPVYADPDNPTAAETTAFLDWKATKDARDILVASVANKCITPS
jgi:prepilin-type N-terminal cleavage/methylation domain-containing protein